MDRSSMSHPEQELVGPHLDEDHILDLLLDLLPDAQMEEAGRHLASCKRCEDLFQRRRALLERRRASQELTAARLDTVVVSDGSASQPGQVPTAESNPVAARAETGSKREWPADAYRWLVSMLRRPRYALGFGGGILVAISLVLLTASPQRAVSYPSSAEWLPSAGERLVLRSDAEEAQVRDLAVALNAYDRRDLPAAEIIADDATGPGTPVNWNHDRTPYSITQNLDPIVLNSGAFTCGNVALGYNTEGWAMRRFSLQAYGIVTPFTVSSVDWGVRRFVARLDSIPAPYNVTVLLYTTAETDPLLFANMTLIASVDVPITMADNPVPPALGVAKHTPIAGLINPIGQDLVVAIHYPEGYSTTPTTRFGCSASTSAETAESYVAFADCGYPEPVTPTGLGSPGTSRLVLIVNGDAEPSGACCLPGSGSTWTRTQTGSSGCEVLGGIWRSGDPCAPDPCMQSPPCGATKKGYPSRAGRMDE